ncbi:MAG: FAD-dependent 5-carboxymethylaminomethyl-2-thiouridine(34) oxidoreductase MnmC [Pseudomonadota bacterium]
MKTAPIRPRALDLEGQDRPWPAAAWAHAAAVFVGGNHLPDRWRADRQRRCVVLDTGWAAGQRFLQTWQAWRETPEPRADLDFIALADQPLSAADAAQALASECPCPALREALLAEWPPLTHNLHSLSFDQGRVRLWLALGDPLEWLPELVLSVDAFYLNAWAVDQAPAGWHSRVYKALARLAAPGATAVSDGVVDSVERGLRTAGFVSEAQATPGDPAQACTRARHAPRPTRHPPPRRTGALAQGSPRQALVIGAGLAGSATAWGLAKVGWHSTVLDAAPEPAAGASGNPAGLFHGIVNGQDGTHARLFRAAALAIVPAVQQALAVQPSCGQQAGLLRLEQRRTATEMQALLDTLGLPASLVQAVDAGQASALGGLSLPDAAWWHLGGGWVDPGALCRSYLALAGAFSRFQGQARVASLAQRDGQWCALDEQGVTLGRAPVAVVANAGDALRLLGVPTWPLQAVRGQISWCDSAAQAACIGWPASGPALPLAGAGYCVPPQGGRRVFGATTQPGDPDPQVRLADHASNLLQLARLQGRPLDAAVAQAQAAQAHLSGRVGWRWTTDDKLPVWGALPDPDGPRADQVRHLRRTPGLFVCTGMGSRGITWSALAGQVLAALISDTPCPIESSLLDAVDPARFQVRAWRAQR